MLKRISTYNVLLILIGLTVLWSCSEQPAKPKSKKKKTNSYVAKPDPYSIHTPRYHDTLAIASESTLKIDLNDSTKSIDSIHVFLNHKQMSSANSTETVFSVQSDKVGINILKTDVYFNDGTMKTKQTEVFLISDIVPTQLKYEVVKQYAHPANHFTQGLVYHNGYLYEGTGQWGRSGLFQMDIESGKPVKGVQLPANVFGEGIAIHKNQIFQLTYKALKAYVYDLETMQLKKQLNYPLYCEGWGLASDGVNLLFSNGSSRLQVLESEGFTAIDQIDVVDNKGQVSMLNELEVIDGYIYANIWLQNQIAKIDPNSGKVVSYLDLTNLVPAEYKSDPSKVLNGIAYNPQSKHWYVTGKDWKYLFEIKVL